jgi:ankyrin repeat protein
MNHKRLITSKKYWILIIAVGLCVSSFANNTSGTDTEAEQHFEKANELRKFANYDAAIAEYEKTISLSPNSRIAQDAQYWIGQTYFEAGQFDAALSSFRNLLEKYTTSKLVPSTKEMIERAEKAKDANLFLKAIKNGDIERIKKLISQGADVNAKDNRGMTPLHKAAYYGQRQVAKVLIDKGANVNETDTAGQTPLHIAANFGWKFVPELLLANGASISARDIAGNTPLHAAADCADGNGNKDLIELLIAKGADVNARNEAGQMPLHFAAKRGYRERIDLLIAKGAIISKDDDNLLGYACRDGRKDLVELLIQKGADLNAEDVEASLTALWFHHVDVLELLLANGADVNAADRWGWSLLHYTALHGDADTTRMLLDKGANPNTVERQRGLTPLHCAALRRGKKTVAEMLLAHGANMDTRDWDGKTPLSLAKENGHTEIVELLRKHGAKE